MSNPEKPQHPKPKGSGDPVQRASREKRIKQALRENLKRRKEKARAVSQPENSTDIDDN